MSDEKKLTACQDARVHWLNSECKLFDSFMRAFKKILRDGRGKKLVVYFRDDDNTEFETDDLGFACYLKMKRFEMTRYRLG